MPHYRVLIEAQNLWIHLEGRMQRMGFYTTRFVHAASEEEAMQAAKRVIRSEAKFKTLSHPEDPPRVLISEIEEVDAADIDGPHGYALYPDDSEAIH